VIEKQRDGWSVATGLGGDKFVRALALSGERPKRKRVGTYVMDEWRPEFGHSTLLALSVEVGEQTIRIKNPKSLAVEARVQQADR